MENGKPKATRTLPTDLIPHRPPFLFVDEIIELDQGRILTQKLADPEADFFKGHYPGNPVMPGVLLCECVFQAGALLLAHRMDQGLGFVGTPVVTRIKEAKFKQIVRPGDMLNIEVVIDEELNEVYFMTGRIMVNGKLAVRVSFAAALVGEEAAE